MQYKVTKTRAFTLCFRDGGGILTLGGVDTSIHINNNVLFAKLLKPNGWFTVNLMDIFMEPQSGHENPQKGRSTGLGTAAKFLKSAKNAIVDSGTTDTYLPRALDSVIKSQFKSFSGVAFVNSGLALTKQQYAALPVFVYRIQGHDSEFIDVRVHPDAYMEKAGAKFINRIYVTESSGAVLGANFMVNKNVIFDIDGKKVGFADSKCGDVRKSLQQLKQGKRKRRNKSSFLRLIT